MHDLRQRRCPTSTPRHGRCLPAPRKFSFLGPFLSECRLYDIGTFRDSSLPPTNTCPSFRWDRSMPNFGFHNRHGNHFKEPYVDLRDVRAAQEEQR